MSEPRTALDPNHLEAILKASSRRLGERLGRDSVAMLARRLTEYIGPAEDDKYSYIWRSAIEDHAQDANRDDPRSILVDAVRDAALGATSTDSPNATDVAKDLLQSPYPTLVRIGIYVCGEHYSLLGKEFWANFNQEWFIDLVYWHEIYWFIRKSFSKFSAAELDTFLGHVDSFKGDWSNSSKQEEWDEIHRRDLLHPAYGLGSVTVDARYEALVRIHGPAREHPDFHHYSTSGWVGERSPVSSDVILAMSDEELTNFLRGFSPDDRQIDAPSYRGVASAISGAVRSSDDGFASRMSLFVDLPRPYQHGLLEGLKARWSEDKRDVDWPKVLVVLNGIVSSIEFRTELKEEPSVERWEPSIRWVVSDIAELLKAAFSTERPLPSSLHDECAGVLREILAAIEPSAAATLKDAVSHSINSPRGRR